jgi:hypothetical protein
MKIQLQKNLGLPAPIPISLSSFQDKIWTRSNSTRDKNTPSKFHLETSDQTFPYHPNSLNQRIHLDSVRGLRMH